ncbi:MAG: GNAT family N-acetyltransferase [Firmicutes bacterium]|nr:GNAT family N-acetyltransferase [Bacillota bacterium]
MLNIKYIADTKFEYNQNIIDGLQLYNRNQSGYREKDYRDFYVFDDDVLVGACHTKLYADWCDINGLYYENIDVLKAIINDIKEYYRDNVVGISFDSVLDQRVSDFKEIGFTVEGKLKDMPSGNDNVFLKDTELVILDVDHDYESKSSKEPMKSHAKVWKKEIHKFRESLDFSTEKIDLQYVVLDRDKFVGGIYGHVQYEYLFINMLFVDKKYRGNRIASKLMGLIEAEAVKRDVVNVYVTTFEFQALGFYQKHGFKVVMTIDDFPKGFQEYTLYKKMKIGKK